MESEHNQFKPSTYKAIHELFPHLNHSVKGWTTTGGTIFNGKKLTSLDEKSFDQLFFFEDLGLFSWRLRWTSRQN